MTDRAPLDVVLAGRAWLTPRPRCELQPLALDDGRTVRLLRDDLLHPLVGGNKLRKLDGLLPHLLADGVTDVVSCGGVQSSHAAAVAAVCAENGLRAHLVLRGERPPQPTGYTLLTLTFAHRVHFVSRTEYAAREAVLEAHAAPLREAGRHVAVIGEGAAQPEALYGCLRLVAALREAIGEGPARLVLDAGTGTTAAGLAAGIALASLPWRVDAVVLVPGTAEALAARACALAAELGARHRRELQIDPAQLTWHPRSPERRFGRLVPGELERCLAVARRTGVLFDPIYTLAALDHVQALDDDALATTVLVHTGGALNLMGIAQRTALPP